MKKIVAFTLALVMMLSLLAGCGSSNGTAGDGKYKIGVILYGKEDTLGGRIYSLLNAPLPRWTVRSRSPWATSTRRHRSQLLKT